MAQAGRKSSVWSSKLYWAGARPWTQASLNSLRKYAIIIDAHISINIVHKLWYKIRKQTKFIPHILNISRNVLGLYHEKSLTNDQSLYHIIYNHCFIETQTCLG